MSGQVRLARTNPVVWQHRERNRLPPGRTGRTAAALAAFLTVTALSPPAGAADPLPQPLAAYFSAETARLEASCLTDISSSEEWLQRRAEYRRQLFDMLGLWPMPPRSELKPAITGTLEGQGYAVEKLHFQSMPGLYVTANLYLPRGVQGRFPAILYACGHAMVKTNGISCGNKTAYQHHGIWFARHGYVCLVIDTVQLGEIGGLHHGTYREGMWWWNARGYTPAGVEAWNCIRALDYLEGRPEVNASRMGMTGRSGGGSYTWTTAALDDRVRVAAPVAGITDLRNQVVDGCVEGHCDCMFFVNTYRWDFPLNAALIAPRPLLIVNTDADSIFPLDGVIRTHQKVRRIYALLGKTDQLGLVIAPGPHNDTQDLQVPVLRWFNQHLKGESPPVEDAAVKRHPPLSLRVFDTLPSDAINPKVHESFGPRRTEMPPVELRAALRRRSFGGWPADTSAPAVRLLTSRSRHGLRLTVHEFDSQEGVTLRLWTAESTGGPNPQRTVLHVLDTNDGSAWAAAQGRLFELEEDSLDRVEIARCKEWARELRAARTGEAWTAPRGVGPTAWSVQAPTAIQIRRRFMLLGQTLDGMRVWDVRRAVQALGSTAGRHPPAVVLAGRGTMAVHALYASLYEDSVRDLDLTGLPQSHRDGPDYLNVLQLLDIPEALALARARFTTLSP